MAIHGRGQIVRGVVNTPSAIVRTARGEVWNTETRKWEKERRINRGEVLVLKELRNLLLLFFYPSWYTYKNPMEITIFNG
jgi:hypothetical protein